VIVVEVVEIVVVHRVVVVVAEVVDLPELVSVLTLTERRDHLDLVCSSRRVWKRNNLLAKKDMVHLTLIILILYPSFSFIQVGQLQKGWAPRLDAAAAGETVERSEHRRQKKILEDQNGPRFVLVLVRRDVKPWVIKGEEV
jgi:hypothetical protein